MALTPMCTCENHKLGSTSMGELLRIQLLSKVFSSVVSRCFHVHVRRNKICRQGNEGHSRSEEKSWFPERT